MAEIGPQRWISLPALVSETQLSTPQQQHLVQVPTCPVKDITCLSTGIVIVLSCLCLEKLSSALWRLDQAEEYY